MEDEELAREADQLDTVKTNKQEKEEERKRDRLNKEMAMNEFLDRGGFATVLNNIFNPPELASMELDSVFQMKKLCK